MPRPAAWWHAPPAGDSTRSHDTGRRPARTATSGCVVLGMLLAAGCGLLPDTTEGEPGTEPAGEAAQREQAAAEEGPWSMEVPFSSDPARFDIEPIERREDRTVLRFTLTPLGDEDGSVLTQSLLSSGFAGFQSVRGVHLLDPVGQRYYYPLSDPDGDRGYSSLGTPLPRTLQNGAHYEMEIHYPRLPDEIDHATLLLPLHTGPLTGIPVVDAASPEEVPGGEVPWNYDVEPGETVVLPVNDGPMGDPEDNVYDLYGITEGAVVERDSSTTEERIALRADVLFEFDEDTLDADAGEILDDIVAETAERADPEKPPIAVVGHTDGVGDDAYNQDLSERRAESVRDYLEDGLGSDYVYETEGRGSGEPVADEGGSDDEEARARNRRVEISYQIREEYLIPEITLDTETVEEHGTGVVAPPGTLDWEPETAEEPEVIGALSGETRWLGFDLEVHPFTRDGAYLVAHFTITPDALYNAAYGATSGDYIGSEFGAFGAVDPDTGQIYRGLRIGEQGGDVPGGSASIYYVDPPGFPHETSADSPNYGYFYLPAPPLDVDSLTFDAGPLGQVEDVPIR